MSRRRMTPEDRALWRRTTSTVRPLDRADILRDHDDEKHEITPSQGVKSKVLARSKSGGLQTSGAQRYRPHSQQRAAPAHKLPDPFAAGDPKAERLVRRGRRDIDAVFDLHGHTQSSARAALYGFILEARARRYSCVLIITGKGVRVDRDGDQVRAGGVLRARFHDWMREDDFRQHVVRVSASHPRHGGGGAYYVFLKRKK